MKIRVSGVILPTYYFADRWSNGVTHMRRHSSLKLLHNKPLYLITQGLHLEVQFADILKTLHIHSICLCMSVFCSISTSHALVFVV